MPKVVSEEKKQEALRLMFQEKATQMQVHEITGLSRPYIRKLAKNNGYQFPRNGVEVKGIELYCNFCGNPLRKSPSRVNEKNFCNSKCHGAYQKKKHEEMNQRGF